MVAGIGFKGADAYILDPDGGKNNTKRHYFSWKEHHSKITMILTLAN